MKLDYFVLLQNDICCSLQNFITAKCACINDGATLTGRDLESLTANDRRQTQVVNVSNQEISRCKLCKVILLRATRGAHNPNLQVVITHVSHGCSQHLFGLPLRMYGMHRTHFNHTHLDILPLVI